MGCVRSAFGHNQTRDFPQQFPALRLVNVWSAAFGAFGRLKAAEMLARLVCGRSAFYSPIPPIGVFTPYGAETPHLDVLSPRPAKTDHLHRMAGRSGKFVPPVPQRGDGGLISERIKWGRNQ